MISQRVSALILGLVNAIWTAVTIRARRPSSSIAVVFGALLGFGVGYGVGWWGSALLHRARQAIAHQPGTAAPMV